MTGTSDAPHFGAVPLKPEGRPETFDLSPGPAPGDAAWPLSNLINIKFIKSKAFLDDIGIHDWYEWAGERYVRTP